MREQAEMLTGMVEAARVASSSLDLRECGNAIAKVVCTHMGASDAAVYRKDTVNGGVEIIGSNGKRQSSAWKRLASHSADSGDYLLISEQLSDPENQKIKIEAILAGIPLATGSGVIGAIVARFSDELNREDLQLGSLKADVLMAFGIHAAEAVSNAEMHLRSEEYSATLAGWVEHLSAVMRVTEAVSSCLTLDEALDALARTTAELMNGDECSIFLPDRENKLFVKHCFCKDDRKSLVMQQVLEPGESLSGYAFSEKHYIACNDAFESTNMLTQNYARQFGRRGVLCAPLVLGDQAIGVITLYNFQPREYTVPEIQLITSIGAHAAAVVRNAGQYTREASIAETLQRGLISEAPEQCRGLKFAGCYIPALDEARVGGDFYDVSPLPNGSVGVVIADVSGKGLRAAIHLATCKYMMRSLIYAHPDDPGVVLRKLNDAINYYYDQVFFMTAFYAVIDPVNRQMIYASAGHPPAVLITESGKLHTCLASTGIPVGCGSPCKYETRHIQAQRSDILLLYTDGVTDAVKDGQRLELEGLHQLLFEAKNKLAPELVRFLYDRLRGDIVTPQNDDIALLAVSFENVSALSDFAGGNTSEGNYHLTAQAS